jgi:nicotinamide mononucleotide adenylyltransferase
MQLNEEHEVGTALIVGRFQPITRTHFEIIDAARKKFQQIFIVVVKGAKSQKDREKNPFPLGLRLRLIYNAFGGKIHPSHIISAPSGFVPEILDNIFRLTSSENLKKRLVLLTGSDRAAAYKKQIDDYFEKDGINVEVQEIARDMDAADSVSASKVREAIKNNDKETFQSLTPLGIHNEFMTLRKFLISESQRRFFRKMFLEMRSGNPG